MNNTILKKTGKTILVILLLALIVVNVLTVIFSNLGLRKQFEWIPYAFLSVNSGSMEPDISTGDLILVHETPYDEIQKGDIITFCDSEGGFTTHKLITKTESGFITKGTANNFADSESVREAYCAKLVCVFPKVGFLIEFFSKPVVAIIGVILILIVFFAIPFVKSKVSAKGAAGNTGIFKTVCALALASVFAVTPFMTAARYRQDINALSVIAAGSVYFTSNYLGQINDKFEGNVYDIRGWDGTDKQLTINIRNSSNSLLINSNVDVPYIIYLETDESAGYLKRNDDYSLEITHEPAPYPQPVPPADQNKSSYHRELTGNNWDSTKILGPFLLEKSAEDQPFYETFGLKLSLLKPIVENATAEGIHRGDKLKFRVMACTNQNSRFYQELKGEFIYHIAETSQFLNPQITNESSRIDIDLLTSYSGEQTTKNIYIYWDPDRLHLNENTPTAIAFLKRTSIDVTYDKQAGKIVFPMESNSHVQLSFPKYSEYQGMDMSNYIYVTDNSEEQRPIFPLNN